MPVENSLVLYKNRPARVRHAADRAEIELPDGETVKVRPKDIVLLHPGPLQNLRDVERAPQDGEVQTAWEILAGSKTTLRELAELAYGAYTPATAWAAWQLAADGLYFRGTPDEITAATAGEVEQKRAARAADAAEKQSWAQFQAHVTAGPAGKEDLEANDLRYLKEVEALALGRTEKSRVLRELGYEESPESAHALLLETSYWDETVNPYPQRLDLPLSPPDVPLPDLPDELRLDLTHLPAFAIDDPAADAPDDAISLDGGRIWVHVADAAALVPPGSAADLEARARAATLYLPETTAPMLPSGIVPVLGLGLQEVSPALSFGIDLDDKGQIAAVEIAPSRVRVTRLTYEAAAALMDQEPFRELYRLAGLHAAVRMANGAVRIELPEVDVRVVGGEVVLAPVAELPSRATVEEAMILAGEAAARFAIEHAIPVPYATQEPTDVVERPTTVSGMYALRRALKRGQHRSVAAPHGGLGLAAYSQATSPLRRYLDLVLHQQLRAYVRGTALLDAQEIVERVGAAEAVLGSVRRAEQLSNRHWTLVYLMRHPGWRGRGILVEKKPRNDAVIIPELSWETLVHLPADLPLDSTMPLLLNAVDLPRLDARFRYAG